MMTQNNKAVSDQDWYEWVNNTYNTKTGRLFIQQIFRICRFWSSPATKHALKITSDEILAYDNVCKQIMNGMSKENIADLLAHTRRTGE